MGYFKLQFFCFSSQVVLEVRAHARSYNLLFSQLFLITVENIIIILLLCFLPLVFLGTVSVCCSRSQPLSRAGGGRPEAPALE